MSTPENCIFVVDDDESVRRGLGLLLQASGYSVELFATADEFLARPHLDGLGCLLLDIQIPGTSGLALHRQLVAQGSDLPIVFLTGRGDIPTSAEAMKRGAIDFLTKPVDETVLIEAIRRAIDVHQQRHRERLARKKF